MEKSAKKQNEPLYERIKTHIGRPPIFETAGDLLDKLIEYCHWCDENPIKADIHSKVKRGNSDSVEQGNSTVARPYTLDGFCLFAGIFRPWATFKKDCQRRKDASEFAIVINACEQTIRDQQVGGAMIGLYSERLTARLNGITEKIEAEVNQRTATVSWDEFRAMIGDGKEVSS